MSLSVYSYFKSQITLRFVINIVINQFSNIKKVVASQYEMPKPILAFD